MVDPEWQEVRRVLEAALDLAETERASFVDRTCGHRAALRQEVMDLLAAHVRAGRALPSPSTPGAEAQRVGRFRIIKQRGRGGSGVVFEAVDDGIGRRVALKVVELAEGRARDGERLHREAAAASALSHPGIVSVLEHGRDADRHWIAMELVPGHDLAHELQLQQGSTVERGDKPELPPRGDKQWVRAVVELCAQIADALHHAHEHGVVHRDIKPSNILLMPGGGAPKIVDFGLAWLEGAGALTVTGEVAGTPAYMSPEQARAEHQSIDRRTDIYSLGAVLFELLAGRPPHGSGAAHVVLDRVRNGDVPRLRRVDPSLPLDLDAVCARAMAEVPAERYSTAVEFAADLRRFMNFEAVLAARYSAWHTTRRVLRRYRRRIVLACASAAAAAIVVGLLWRTARENQFADQVGTLDARIEAAMGRRDLQELRLIHAAATVLRPQLAASSSPALRRVDALLVLLRAHGDELIANAERQAKESLASAASSEADEPSLLQAISAIAAAAPLVEPRTVVGRDVADWFPLLSVASEPSGAEVFLLPATVPDGNFRMPAAPLGRTPLARVPVAPGQYRVLVRDGDRIAELTRWLGVWSANYDLGTVRLSAPSEVTANMVRVEAGVQELRLAAYLGPSEKFPVVRVAHDAFFIDRCEVSNQDYSEFLAAFPDASDLRPLYWQADADDDWRRRPVVRVSYRQMCAYAEWRGKRLPTEAEWAAAAFGSEARKYPWGNAAEPGRDAVVGRLATPLAREGGAAQQAASYLRCTAPVDFTVNDRTSAGVLHLAGNVSEMTDSIGVLAIDGRFVALPALRRLKGCSFADLDLGLLHSHSPEQISAPFATPTVGFRCAKSVPPTYR